MNADLSSIAIQTANLGKMYKMYSSRRERILDTLGLNCLFFWRRKQYQEFWALRGINLTIRKGERGGKKRKKCIIFAGSTVDFAAESGGARF